MNKIITILILNIFFLPVVHAESGADESKKQEACTILLFASTAASVIEDACSFRDGVVGKYSTFF